MSALHSLAVHHREARHLAPASPQVIPLPWMCPMPVGRRKSSVLSYKFLFRPVTFSRTPPLVPRLQKHCVFASIFCLYGGHSPRHVPHERQRGRRLPRSSPCEEGAEREPDILSISPASAQDLENVLPRGTKTICVRAVSSVAAESAFNTTASEVCPSSINDSTTAGARPSSCVCSSSAASVEQSAFQGSNRGYAHSLSRTILGKGFFQLSICSILPKINADTNV